MAFATIHRRVLLALNSIDLLVYVYITVRRRLLVVAQSQRFLLGKMLGK